MTDTTALLLQYPWLFPAAVLLIALLIGSFLNVVILRLPIILQRQLRTDAQQILEAIPEDPQPLSLATPRSHCPHCHQLIRSWENIPVFSWVALRGRCGRCRAPISPRYPLIELLTGALSVLVALWFGPHWTTLWVLGFLWALIALTFIDLDTMYLPDNITIPLICAGLLFNLNNGGFVPLQDAVIGALAGYASLGIVFALFRYFDGREGLGHGDFKLLAALGAWLGWQALPVITAIAAGVGAAVTGVLILIGRHRRDQPVPFGPYLTGAGFIVLIFRDHLLALLLGPAFAV